MGAKVESALSVLNGIVGDYLVRTGNPLAMPMVCLPREGLPNATRAVVLVHGLMGTETNWTFENGEDYGSMLGRDFGWAPRYLRYNTGLPIARNGADLSKTLDALVAGWDGPLDEIMLLGHSMGGLVTRAACHVAGLQGSAWLSKVKRAIYVGTPHLGAPMERVGRVVAKVLKAVDDPYTQLIAQIAELRSDGIKDLGNADLREEDRARRLAGVRLSDPRHPVPLLPQIRHLLIAGTIHPAPWAGALFGDAMVPLGSATNGLLDAKILPGILHMPLAHRMEVYDAIRAWLGEGEVT
jgi:triacylglycerol lipase